MKKKNECPVCGGHKQQFAELCVDCIIFQSEEAESRKRIKRIEHFCGKSYE